MKDLLVVVSASGKAPICMRFGPVSGKLKKHSLCPCGSGRTFKKCCRPEFKAKGLRVRLPKALLPRIKALGHVTLDPA